MTRATVSGLLPSSSAIHGDGQWPALQQRHHPLPQRQLRGEVLDVGGLRWPLPRSSRRRPGRACDDTINEDAPATSGNPTVPDGIVAAVAFVTTETVGGDACGPSGQLTLRTLFLARVTESGKTEVRAVNTLLGSTEAATPVITPRLVVPNYETAVLIPWIATTPDGRVENHITRVEGERIAEYTLPFLGEVGIGDDTAYTVTDDEKTVVVFDPVSGRVKYVKHTTGKLSVVAVDRSGKVVMQHTGVMLDEHYKPEEAPIKPWFVR